MSQPSPSIKLGKYTTRSLISRGSMGMVYLAHDGLLERDVAVKVMVGASVYDKKMRARFEREARAVARLQHPNIITIHDLGYDQNGSPFIAMELLEGIDLDELVETRPPAIGRRLDLIAQVCRGLAHAHRHGVVHRDIKPANIFVTEDGCAKIMDFGVARMTQTTQTQAGIVVGTAGYMSPEQLRGKPADGRSDIFSLGVTLFEILTNEVLFSGDAIETVFFQTLSKQTPTLIAPDGTKVPELQKILNRALAKKAEDRYWSADEMEEAIQDFLRSNRAFAEEKTFLKIPDTTLRPQPSRAGDAQPRAGTKSASPIHRTSTPSSRPRAQTARRAHRHASHRLTRVTAVMALLVATVGTYFIHQSVTAPAIQQPQSVGRPTFNEEIPPPVPLVPQEEDELEPVSSPEPTPRERAAVFAADAALAIHAGDLEEADSLISRGERLDPESPRWAPLRRQLRVKEVEIQRNARAVGLVGEARRFLEAGSYQSAIDAYKEAVELDPQNLQARSELNRAIELEQQRVREQERPAAAPRRFAESETEFIPNASDPGKMMGFEMEERLGIKETADALLPAQLVIELDPIDAAPGEPYVLQVSVYNEGYETLELRSLELVSRFGQKEAAGKGQQIPVRVRQVAPQTKAVLHEVAGTWKESQNYGEIEVTVTLMDGGRLIKTVRW